MAMVNIFLGFIKVGWMALLDSNLKDALVRSFQKVEARFLYKELCLFLLKV